MASVLLIILLLSSVVAMHGQPLPTTLVPAMFIFGDSSVDVGNNNYIAQAKFKANYPPYGADFAATHVPTGRFCNGKLVADFTAEALGFTTFPVPYLSQAAMGKRLLMGANFASAGSGYYEGTAARYNAISLSQQLKNFEEYRFKLVRVTGKKTAATTLSEALYILSTGNGDFVQNYYINPSLRKTYTLEQFSSIVLHNFSCFVEGLYKSGARRIGVSSLPAMGCFPATINHYGHGSKQCVSWLNRDAQVFNKKLRATVASLAKHLPSLKIVVLDIYKPLVELATDTSKHGFSEAKRGCCGTGTAETTIECKPDSPLVCRNALKYVFWDGLHPSEAANRYISSSVMLDGLTLLS